MTKTGLQSSPPAVLDFFSGPVGPVGPGGPGVPERKAGGPRSARTLDGICQENLVRSQVPELRSRDFENLIFYRDLGPGGELCNPVQRRFCTEI